RDRGPENVQGRDERPESAQGRRRRRSNLRGVVIHRRETHGLPAKRERVGPRNSMTPRCAMSRVGKAPIPVPGDVKVTIADGKVVVEGKKGAKLDLAYHPNMQVKYDAAAKTITVTRP